jgi:hypothetical protein
MPLTLPAGGSDTYDIIGVKSGTPPMVGLQLASGQTITVVSSDPNTVAISADATPVATAVAEALADGTPVPAGTPTVASGTVSGAANPAQANVAINVTATVSNADGTVAETATDTVTVNPALPATADSIGVLFGVLKTVRGVKR